MTILTKILSLIPRTSRRKGLFVTILVIVCGAFDLFSLASFLPVVVLLIAPAGNSRLSILQDFQTWSGFSDPTQFAIALTVVAILLTVLKTALNNFAAHRKAAFAYSVANDIALATLNRYLHTSYATVTSKSYSRELNRMSNLPIVFANNFIITSGTILAEAFVAIILISAVAIYEFKAFLVLLLIVIPVSLLYRSRSTQIRSLSREIKRAYPELTKQTLQVIEAYPEVRGYRKEIFFKKKFTEAFRAMSSALATEHNLKTVTSRMAELMTAICSGGLIIYALVTGKSHSETILLLSIYAGTSFRLIPSVNRIFNSIMQIRTHEYVLEELKQSDYHEDTVTTSDDFIFKEKIELENVSFGYSADACLLRNASITIKKGDKILLSGKSGGGKTTTLLMLMHFIRPQSGKVLIDGNEIAGNPDAFQRLIGYIPQQPYLLNATIAENIAFGVEPELIDYSKLNDLVSDLGLREWVDSLPKGADTLIGERGAKISGGQRQRLAICRALYNDAEILLLDEITNQLDFDSEKEIVQAFSKPIFKKKTVVLITHKPDLWLPLAAVYELRNGNFVRTVHQPVLDPRS